MSYKQLESLSNLYESIQGRELTEDEERVDYILNLIAIDMLCEGYSFNAITDFIENNHLQLAEKYLDINEDKEDLLYEIYIGSFVDVSLLSESKILDEETISGIVELQEIKGWLKKRVSDPAKNYLIKQGKKLYKNFTNQKAKERLNNIRKIKAEKGGITSEKGIKNFNKIKDLGKSDAIASRYSKYYSNPGVKGLFNVKPNSKGFKIPYGKTFKYGSVGALGYGLTKGGDGDNSGSSSTSSSSSNNQSSQIGVTPSGSGTDSKGRDFDDPEADLDVRGGKFPTPKDEKDKIVSTKPSTASGKELPKPRPVKPGSARANMIARNKEIFGKDSAGNDRVDKLRVKDAAFQASKKSGSNYSKNDFIKDFPKSNAAKDSRKNKRVTSVMDMESNTLSGETINEQLGRRLYKTARNRILDQASKANLAPSVFMSGILDKLNKGPASQFIRGARTGARDTVRVLKKVVTPKKETKRKLTPNTPSTERISQGGALATIEKPPVNPKNVPPNSPQTEVIRQGGDIIKRPTNIRNTVTDIANKAKDLLKGKKVKNTIDKGITGVKLVGAGYAGAELKKRTSNNESYDAYDLVLNYIMETEQASTIEEANYIMIEMDQNTIHEIVEEQKKTLTEWKGKLAAGAVLGLPYFMSQLEKRWNPVKNARDKYQDKKATEYEKKSGTTKEDGYFR